MFLIKKKESESYKGQYRPAISRSNIQQNQKNYIGGFDNFPTTMQLMTQKGIMIQDSTRNVSIIPTIEESNKLRERHERREIRLSRSNGGVLARAISRFKDIFK